MDENPLRAYLQSRSSDAEREMLLRFLGGAGLSSVGGALTILGPDMISKGLGVYGLTQGVDQFDKMGDAAKRSVQLDRGAKMWGNTGLPGRPAEEENTNPLLYFLEGQ